MKNIDVIILAWHQIYLSSNAGGYVRLKEFLKRLPKDLHVVLLDNKPTLFKEDISSANLVVYDTPIFLKGLRKKVFLFWLLLETIIAGFVVYKTADNLIKEGKCKALYVPIGEFPQLYIPGIILKKKYPDIKLVVDILNFELPDKNAFAYYKRLRANGVGLFRAFITIIMFYIGFFITSTTIKFVDYVFTVSPELVESIKKVYKKNTIDFTPSGVDTKQYILSDAKKYSGVYVGRVNIHKGVADLIDTWSIVAGKKHDAVLVIAGYVDDAINEYVKQEIKRRNLEKNIIIKGQITDKEKFALLSESEIFLHLARYEPLFPVIGILEGLASGLYTIVYDMPVVSSQSKKIKSEKSLAIIKNGDIQGVAKAIINYLSLPSKNKKNLAKEARKFASLYDWNIIADKEFSVIRRLIKKS